MIHCHRIKLCICVLSAISNKLNQPVIIFLQLAKVGHTLQNNEDDLGLNSPLLTILSKDFILLVILSDFPVMWGVVRVIEFAWKNIRSA